MPQSLSSPLVSVIIPAYNQSQYLGKAIESVLAQTYTHLETIIVDDGSTDDTATVSRHYTSDKRVRYIFQENAGLSAARNTGIRHARGKYLTFLDSDDLFLPHKLDILVKRLKREPHLGLTAGQAQPINEDGQPIGSLFDEPLPEDERRLLLGNPLHVGSVLLRRSWQEEVGLFDESLRSYEDWDMWLRLALAGCPMDFVHTPVSLYRFHRAQMTRDGSQMTRATFAVLDNLFAREDLPSSWRDWRELAYSRAHLRAAAQAFRTADYTSAASSLNEAIEYDPSLMNDGGKSLAQIMMGWTELPKIASPLTYLGNAYNNLPASLSTLRRRKHEQLGELALRLAYNARKEQDIATTRKMMRRAIRHRPAYLMNRGILLQLLRSHIAWLTQDSR